MDRIDEFLHSLQAGKVLDVATGRGDFLQFLRESLGGCASLTGIDFKEFDQWKSESFGGSPPVEFKVMDGMDLKYTDGYFSLVAISNSLHHLSEPQTAVDEMVRVLAPQGILLLHEMIADDDTNTPSGTHTLLHRWWGKIDTTRGIFHRPPYLRAELKQLVQHKNLFHWVWVEEAEVDSDPHDAQTVQELEKIITDYQDRTTDKVLIAEGEELRQRVSRIGFLPATALWGYAVKKAEVG